MTSIEKVHKDKGEFYKLIDNNDNLITIIGIQEEITINNIKKELIRTPVHKEELYKFDNIETNNLINKISNIDTRPDYSSESPWGIHESNLNNLLNHQGLNDPNKILYITSLVNEHNIKKESKVIDEFNNHIDSKCDICGQHNTYGKFEDLVEDMYDSQVEEFGYKMYSKETCYKYIYDLYTRKTINGIAYETEAINKLSEKTDHIFKKPTGDVDGTYAVDIIVEHHKVGDDFAGIQVKPKSYDISNNEEMKIINKDKNNKYQYPVYYLYYDKNNNNNTFVNIDDVINKIDI